MLTTLIKLVLAVVVLASFLTELACGGGSSVNNTNANTTNVNSTSSETAIVTDSACNENNINTRLQKVTDAVARKIGNKPGLQDQLDRGVFKYQIVIGPGTPGDSLDMYIEGQVGGKDNFADLIGIIKNFIQRKCTDQVYFVAPGTLPIKPTTGGGGGFEWFACEDPNVPCPGGECLLSCPAPPGGNVNTNTNTKTNTNSGNKNNQKKDLP